MTLRPHCKQRTVQLEDKAREQQKYFLRVLEECRQISKLDRLQIRELIKRSHNQAIDIFRAHKKCINYSELQIHLRKYIQKLKLQKQNQLIKGVRKQIVKQPFENKVVKKPLQPKPLNNAPKKRWFNTGSLNSSRQFIGKKQIGMQSQRDSPRHHKDRIYNTAREDYLPFKELSKLNLERKDDYGSNFKENTIVPIFQYNTNNLNSSISYMPQDRLGVFTDPKLLQQCRGMISSNEMKKMGKNALCFNNIEIRGFEVEPFLIFAGKFAEEIMDVFFLVCQTKISVDAFRFRMQEFIKENKLTPLSVQKIDQYFSLLSQDKEYLDIAQFGKTVNQYCLPQFNEARKLFTTIDKNKLGFVTRDQFKQGRWQRLFDKANYLKKQSLGYWEIYSLRKSWQFFDFAQWFQNQQFSFF